MSYMCFSQHTRVWRAKGLFNTNLKNNTNFKKIIPSQENNTKLKKNNTKFEKIILSQENNTQLKKNNTKFKKK